LALTLVEAVDEILAGVDLLRAACRRRAEEHRATVAIGRSHGVHAEPITAGLVFAGFYAELGRARAALVAARSEIAVGKIAGAVGTYANLDPAIELAALTALGLRRETVPTQIVARDRHAGYFAALARLGTAVERIALTVRPRRSGRGRRARRRCRTRRTRSCPRTCAASRACCAGTAPPPSRTSRSGTSETSRTRRSSG
jgi:adenylosuccinate lyase